MGFDSESQRMSEIHRYYRQRFSLAARMTVLGIVGVALIAAVATTFVASREDKDDRDGQTLEERIADLSTQLDDSAKSISAIESEIEARRQLVADLQAKKEQYEALTGVTPEQVEAISQALDQQFDKNRSFWDSPLGIFLPGFVIGSLFFILGTFVAGPWLQRRRA